jgi:hypothetical protein
MVKLSKGGNMFDEHCRPWGRLFYLLTFVAVGTSWGQTTPATSTVQDVVYRAEDRITQLEKSEIRRGVYDRIVNAAITVAISAAIAMHDRWSFK